MHYKFILLFVILFLSLGTASAQEKWIPNSSIVTGLIDVGTYSTPTIYNHSNTWKLISGENDGVFNGYQWNGATWISNSSIITGLGSIGFASTPAVFSDSGILKLISGNSAGIFYGYQWNGTSWVSNASIVSGLIDVGFYSTPTVFSDSGILKLISGENSGTFIGYQWNGTSWVSNSSIVTGLIDVGFASSPVVFNDSGTLKLISGENDGVFNGYQWNGATWISNSSIITGLVNVEVNSKLGIFNDSGTLKLITGEHTGIFIGYQWNALPVTSNLYTESIINNSQIYTNVTTPYFNWTYSDADSDTQYSWELQVGTASGLSDMWDSGQLLGTDLNDVYAGSTLSRNTTYYVQVRTNDSYENSTWETRTFKINALPVVNNVVITPGAPTDIDDLVVSNDTATDGNNDPITVYYRWYKDNVLQTALNDIITINQSNLTTGEIWKVGAIPNDGYENGTQANSSTVTIGANNYAPTLTSITTNVSTKKYGYTILVSTVGANDQDDDNYTLHIGNSSGASNLCNSSSTVNGTEASCSFIVPWTSGSHTLYGRLTDANDTSAEETVIITVDVTPPVYVSSGVSPSTLGTDKTANITASITLANGTIDYVKVKVVDTNLVSTNYTMSNVSGTWTYTFSPSASGNYLVSTIYAADDSGNGMSQSVSHSFTATDVSGGPSGGAAPNITVVGDLKIVDPPPPGIDTYFFYTAISGEQKGVYTFVANRNLETCKVEPNDYATCEIIDGYIVEVTLTVNETVKAYDGVLTVTDENDYVASSIIVVDVIKIWGAIPIGEIDVGPLAEFLSIFFEISETLLVGIRTWFVLSIIGLFGFTVYKSRTS